jgi:hypothetical protein
MKAFRIITILLFLINISHSITKNYGSRIRNTGLRLIIFNDTKKKKLFKEFKKFYELCYNKSVAYIAEGVNEYNNLSEDDKMIIETVLSLIY